MDHDLEWIIPYPGNNWKLDFYKLLVSWKYWKLKSSTFSLILEILEIWFFYFSYILEILEICDFLYFGIFSKKTRAEISRRMHRRMSRDLSYETDSGQKLKLFQTPISRWRRRRRRRRRRADNSPIWPDPWTITPRDQISRSGSIPHFDIANFIKLMEKLF